MSTPSCHEYKRTIYLVNGLMILHFGIFFFFLRMFGVLVGRALAFHSKDIYQFTVYGKREVSYLDLHRL